MDARALPHAGGWQLRHPHRRPDPLYHPDGRHRRGADGTHQSQPHAARPHPLRHQRAWLRLLRHHLFRRGDEFIETDVVYGVKEPLIVDFVERPPGKAPTGEVLATPFYEINATSCCRRRKRRSPRRASSRCDLDVSGRREPWDSTATFASGSTLLRMGDKRTTRLRCHAPARYKASASRPHSSSCWVDGGPLEPVAVVESAASCAPERVSRTSGGAVDRRAGFPLRQLARTGVTK